MKKQINQNLTVEALTIEQAVARKLLTKKDAIDYHEWNKGVSMPVDEKHFIYVNRTFAGICEHLPSESEMMEIAKSTIEMMQEKKYIIQVNAGTHSAPINGYLCHNNVSKSYSIGVLEFASEEEAIKYATDNDVKFEKIVEV